MSSEWFSRFADIPGISYSTPDGIDRRKLRGASERPQITKYGDGQQSLSWPTADGSTSASPARRRAFNSDVSKKDTTALARHLYETLELPGQVGDYHFAIQGVIDQLWKRRRAEPSVLPLVERLAWLDVDLIRARPDTITNDYIDAHPDQTRFYRVTSFAHLITLYEREVALREALDVAEIAARFGQHQTKRDELAERLNTPTAGAS